MSGQNPEKRLGPAVAEEVRALLARRRISVVQLAKMMGVSQPYLSRRVNGAVAFDLDDMERLADVLDVAVTDLMPQRVGAAKQINERSTPIGRTATADSTQRRPAHRPPGRVSAGQRRPVSVRSPGYTMSATRAA